MPDLPAVLLFLTLPLISIIKIISLSNLAFHCKFLLSDRFKMQALCNLCVYCESYCQNYCLLRSFQYSH